MKPRNEKDSLHDLINTLEQRRSRQLELLKEQLHDVRDSMTPLNLIKRLFHKAVNPPIKDKINQDPASLCLGFISKKLQEGNSPTSFKKIFWSLVRFGATHLFSKQIDTLKSKLKIP